MSKLTKEEFELLKDAGYSEKVIELYRNKVNVGVIEKPDVNLAYTGPCGDTMKIYLKISDEDVVEDAKFQYLGCPGAASSGSAITRIVKGKTLEEAKRITEQDILKDLGGLPESKLHCPKLAVTTLEKAITMYEERKRRPS
ncbi:MAG: iron-sulfur cluster assembly scaffold protein [Candidatus Bathyarchaeota archaeon]|nr:iron-sulfur cluster assembly scaffold protein [Candidatus Bathyarchaeota archaeon]MDH5662857.1 iron-sulfur cluster assembly scaffold protein [Candidatus Bathyarchaeota archaeon]